MNPKKIKTKKIRKIGKESCFYGIFIGILLAWLSFNGEIFFAEPHVPGQNHNQRVVFNQILGRIERNMTNNPEYFPNDIVDVVDSLKTDGMSIPPIMCPPNAKVDEVHINIKTQLILWDTELTINNQKVNIPNFTAGYYVWNVPPPTIEGGTKTYNITNYIMLDPSVTSEYERSFLGQLANEGLLYHEFLHGQLQINAMKNNTTWQQAVCNCPFDRSYADPNHGRIYGLVDTYLENETAAMNAIAKVARPVGEAGKNGKFKVFIAEAKKKKFKWSAVYPDYCNVVTNSIEIIEENGNFYVTGKLLDQEKAGYFFVYVDPPSIFLFAGIERGVVILPDPPQLSDSRVPSTDAENDKNIEILLLVFLPILGGTILYLKKRLQR